MLGPRFCVRAFSSCGERGPILIAVRRLLTIAASLVAEHRLQMLRLSSCGSRAQLLRGMGDPPRPVLEPMSPALAGRLSTTAPPGKPLPHSYLRFQTDFSWLSAWFYMMCLFTYPAGRSVLVSPFQRLGETSCLAQPKPGSFLTSCTNSCAQKR